MIGFLEGRLFRKEPDHIILMTGGVGYHVAVSFQTYCELPDVNADVALEIYHHVKEDRSELYGFASVREKALFEKLITISGIGPRTALGILSPHPASQVEAGIESEDVTFLTKIPGIGKKTAQRVILELKGKLALPSSDDTSPVEDGSMLREDALNVLVNLGYKRLQAEKTVDTVLKEHNPDDFEDLLKLVFESLGS